MNEHTAATHPLPRGRLNDPIQLVHLQFLRIPKQKQNIVSTEKGETLILRNVFMCSCRVCSFFGDPAHNVIILIRRLPLLFGKIYGHFLKAEAGTERRFFRFLCLNRRHLESWTLSCKGVRKFYTTSPLSSKPVLIVSIWEQGQSIIRSGLRLKSTSGWGDISLLVLF